MGSEAPTDERVSPVKKVLIDLDLGSGLEFPPEQVYDGNGASMEKYDAQDVIDSMKASGSKYAAVADWALLDWDDVDISVSVIREDGSRTHAQW